MPTRECLDLSIIDVPWVRRNPGCGAVADNNGVIPPAPAIPLVNAPLIQAVPQDSGGCEPYKRADHLVYKRVVAGYNEEGFPDWVAAPGSVDPTAHYNITLISPNYNMAINGPISTRNVIQGNAKYSANNSFRDSTFYYNGWSSWCEVPFNRSVTKFFLTSHYTYEEPPPAVVGVAYNLTTIYEGFIAFSEFLKIGDRPCDYTAAVNASSFILGGYSGGFVYYVKSTTSWDPSWPPFTFPRTTIDKKLSIIKNTRVTACSETGFTVEGTLHPLTLLSGPGVYFGGLSPSPNFNSYNVFYRGTCPDAPSFGGNFRAICERE